MQCEAVKANEKNGRGEKTNITIKNILTKHMYSTYNLFKRLRLAYSSQKNTMHCETSRIRKQK